MAEMFSFVGFGVCCCLVIGLIGMAVNYAFCEPRQQIDSINGYCRMILDRTREIDNRLQKHIDYVTPKNAKVPIVEKKI